MPNWSQTILGEPASKANSRRIIWKQRRSIKSEKALSYSEVFKLQCKPPKKPYGRDVRLTCTVYYASWRPDLDIELIKDLLEKCGVYKNDRQVVSVRCDRFVDRDNPRTEIVIEDLGTVKRG